MPKDFPEQRDPNTGTEGIYANRADISPADRALLESATAEAAREAADKQPGTLADDDDVNSDVRAEPLSETTRGFETSGYEETADGLDDTEEAVREQAEDRATGDNEDFVA